MDGFDWYEFNNLADSYLDEHDEAKQRTGVSRYYYGAFCTARDFLNENEIYLDSNSKSIMNSKKVDVHGETSRIFRKHENFQNYAIGRIISKELNKLRKMRNEADYDKITSASLDKLLIKSKNKSDRIFELLEQLN